MSNAFFNIPIAKNEPILDYRPGSPEKIELKSMLKELQSKKADIPMYIGGKEVFTDNKVKIYQPHDLSKELGQYSQGGEEEIKMAIKAAMKAKKGWEDMAWQDRAAIFLKAADLLSGPYRAKMNAATMLCQSKSVFQAEIDCVAELADFYRFNVQYMTDIYKVQPESAPGIWNRLEYRALEGFIFALTPFNFTSIAGNLPAAPALMGNTVVWKAAGSQVYSAAVIMEILKEAGLPDGVINLVFVRGSVAGKVIFSNRDFGGLHFTGGTGTFQTLWKTIGKNISKYKSYPRIVGETGGKDFILAHPSADAKAVATAMSRGAFEYQGQKCSAASRAYLPKSKADEILKMVKADLESFKIGDPNDFRNFFNAVIDRKAFESITWYIDDAKKDKDVEVFYGGNYDDSKGYFIDPTILISKTPKSRTMVEEIFGPVLTVYIYDDTTFNSLLKTLDTTSPYALTGAIFSQDREVIAKVTEALRHSAGNFYINDKPTGAVVGQQPFGGARGSGTNDKAGSVLNLYRWISPRTIKETFVSPKDYRYPFLDEK